MQIYPSEQEINEVLNKCSDNIDKSKSKFPGMSYEEGVESAIRWILGDEETNPMDD